MMGSVLRRLVPFAALSIASPALAAEAAAPDDFVRAEISSLADLLTGRAPDRFDAVRSRVRAIADFEDFARQSLGKVWSTLSPAEQKRFTRTIQRVLESHYMSKPGSIFDKQKVSVVGAKLSGDAGEEAVVSLTVKRKDVDASVSVKLHRDGATWIADDVAIDGLSLLDDYRAQFRTFLKKHSVAELMSRLEASSKARYEKH